MSGWVYVITNKAMPGIIKIGFSTRPPERRAAELNHTGTPHPYLVDYEIKVNNPRLVERRAHERLRYRREGKEWFRCSVEEGIAAIKAAAGARFQNERSRRAEREKARTLQRQEIERRKHEAILEEKRREVLVRYERIMEELLPNWGSYFIGFFILGVISLFAISPHNLIFPSNFLAITIMAVIGSFIITPFIYGIAVKRCEKSPQYQSVIAKRNEELKVLENRITVVLPASKLSAIQTAYAIPSSDRVSRYCPKCKSVYLSELHRSEGCPNCKEVETNSSKNETAKSKKLALERRKRKARRIASKARARKGK